ncbi:MAG: secretin N-terminal domain-containing protein, partial [Planctomycetota bacterium]
MPTRSARIVGCSPVALAFVLALMLSTAEGQYNAVIPAGAPPEVRAQIEAAQRAQGQPSGDKKKDESKGEDEKGEKKEGDDKKKDEAADDKNDGPVKRPNEPPKPPDPRELEAEPDANGRVSFSFHGQAWADVLQWLANVSNLSLDWRELPGDYLNLTTQRAYTLVEARDLINRHLQARGYTLLLSGEVLSVFKLDQLDPSLVPRVNEEDLYDRQPHDVVKLSLPTPPGLDPKQAVEDVKQALSPNAKVMPLAATKRLLLIDTVANLRMVSALLNEERLAAEGRTVPREFVLKHVQAPAVIDMLYVVLGMDPNSRPSQMELRMQQQKLELMSQMAQRGKDVMKLMTRDGPKVYLVYNRQRNSVLANAPPEQMEVIARTIEALDVPVGGQAFADSSDRRLEQYRLKTIAPNAVITTLKEIGNLSPRAELRGDTDSKTIFARGNDSDHEKIQRLIDQLDGAETVVEVFWLRRLPAEAVAGSIESLIINKPKKKKKNNDYPFFFYRRNDDEPEEPDTLLRVDADIENNRLIVRGTPQQLDEVRDLLVKLGEPIGDRADNRRVRTLDTLGPQATAELLRKLEAAWPAVGGDSELVLPPERDLPKAEDEEEDARDESPSDVTASHSADDSPFRLLTTPVADS